MIFRAVSYIEKNLIDAAWHTRLRSLLFGAVLSVSSVFAFAQNESNSADYQWRVLTAKIAPRSSPVAAINQTANGVRVVAGPKKTKLELDDSTAQKRTSFIDAASAARAFYRAFPNDARAGEAKKMEVVASLMSVDGIEKSSEISAIKLADDFRKDSANPIDARFAVALLSERVQARAKLGGVFSGNSAELAKIADKLHKEFGDIPPVFRFESSLARTGDNDTAARFAKQILAAPKAPADCRADAQIASDRLNLIGARVDLRLATGDGKGLDLVGRKSGRTIVYLWSVDMIAPFAELAKFGKKLPQDTEILYVRLGANSSSAISSPTPPIAGLQGFELTGAAPTVAQKLKVQALPYVYLLKSDGTVAGFGSPAQLPALLAASDR